MNLIAALLLTIQLGLAQDEAAFEAVSEPPMGAALTDEAEIDRQADAVSRNLRCPVCQGLSVAESREGLSLAMKERIRELVAAGYTQEQIIDYFVDRYGEGIVLLPDERHWLVWLGPLFAGIAGLGIVGWQIRRRQPGRSQDNDDAPITPAGAPAGADDDYRRRVLAELEEG